ncbi:MAG: diadenosine tetraphosphate (Ap4A) HIT family hydrolase [Planctomycetota bacterium]|jgi:diadenosine tetraphosphate (Ap4A) HIT family hydrolase
MTDLSIDETDNFTIEQSAEYRLPGYLIVQNKNGAREFSDLDAGAGVELQHCLSRAEAMLRELLEPERTYICKFAELNPVMHFHLFPRTARVGEVYAAQTQETAPFNGARLMAWTWEKHALFGFSDEDIADFVGRAREWSLA